MTNATAQHLLETLGEPPRELCLDWACQLIERKSRSSLRKRHVDGSVFAGQTDSVPQEDFGAQEEGSLTVESAWTWADVQVTATGKLIFPRDDSQDAAATPEQASRLLLELAQWAGWKGDGSAKEWSDEVVVEATEYLSAAADQYAREAGATPSRPVHDRAANQSVPVQRSSPQIRAPLTGKWERPGDAQAKTRRRTHATPKSGRKAPPFPAWASSWIGRLPGGHLLTGGRAWAVLAGLVLVLVGASILVWRINPFQSSSANVPTGRSDERQSVASLHPEVAGRAGSSVPATSNGLTSGDTLPDSGLATLDSLATLSAPDVSKSGESENSIQTPVGGMEQLPNFNALGSLDMPLADPGNVSPEISDATDVTSFHEIAPEGAPELPMDSAAEFDVMSALATIAKQSEADQTESEIVERASERAGEAAETVQPSILIQTFPMVQVHRLPSEFQFRARKTGWDIRLEVSEGFVLRPVEAQRISGREVANWIIREENAKDPATQILVQAQLVNNRGNSIRWRVMAGAPDVPPLVLPLGKTYLDGLQTSLSQLNSQLQFELNRVRVFLRTEGIPSALRSTLTAQRKGYEEQLHLVERALTVAADANQMEGWLDGQLKVHARIVDTAVEDSPSLLQFGQIAPSDEADGDSTTEEDSARAGN